MTQKIIQQGAEAKIILNKNLIIKDRIKKSYRIAKLDEKIRKRRTKAEKKLMLKASKIISVPVPKESKEFDKLKMPFVDGKKLSEHLDSFPLAKQKRILREIGEETGKLHKADIIHGDLTTSNMILVENIKDKKTVNKKRGDNRKVVAGEVVDKSKLVIYFIDFGLGYFNGKYEDKAVDIHLLKQALEAKHFKNWEILFKEFKKGYFSINKKEAEKVFNQLIKVEKRGRYKG